MAYNRLCKCLPEGRPNETSNSRWISIIFPCKAQQNREFSHEKWWFSIEKCQRFPPRITISPQPLPHGLLPQETRLQGAQPAGRRRGHHHDVAGAAGAGRRRGDGQAGRPKVGGGSVTIPMELW